MVFPTSRPRRSDAARFDADARDRVHRARDEFIAERTSPAPGEVPVEILSSWVRSLGLGVDPDRVEVPVNPQAASRSQRLVNAAAPIMQALADQCRDADAWGMLLDRECVQVSRIVGDARVVREGEQRGGGVGAVFHEAFVGTNGAGISAERLESFLVVGDEHFRAGERNLASVGVPLHDPFGRMVGFLLMCQRVDTANHMIVPYTQSLAHAIDEQLALAADGEQRALFEAYARHSRRPSLAVVGINDDVFVANIAAQQLLRDGAQNDALRELVREVARSGRSRLITAELGEDRYRVHCRVVPFMHGRHGVVASLTRAPLPTTSVAAPAPSVPVDPVRRAAALRLATLVTGEPGSGRVHRIRDAAPAADAPHGIAEIDAASHAADPIAWFARLNMIVAAGPVLVRDIDTLPGDAIPRVLETLRGGKGWVTATAHSASNALAADFLVTVVVEPLRERTGDLPEIVRALLDDLGAGSVRVSAEALSILAKHSWPGNVAQLRRVLASALVGLSVESITIDDLPREIADAGRRAGDEGLLARTERELIFDALRAADWNRDAAAKALGISRATMYRRIRQFGFALRASR